MAEGTRSKLSLVGVAVAAVLAGNMFLLLLATGAAAVRTSLPKATITSQAVFAKLIAAQSGP
jgi:hypothetical protein